MYKISDFNLSKNEISVSCMTEIYKIKSINWLSDIICFSKQSPEIQETIKAITNDEEIIYLTRKDIFSEIDPRKKFIKVLMWGYPKAMTFISRGENNPITKILLKSDEAIKIITDLSCKSYTESNFLKKVEKIKEIPGMGISTLSKLLYFFNVTIDNKQCVIFDSRVKKGLQHYQDFMDIKTINQTALKSYPAFVDYINNVSIKNNMQPDLIEYILFKSSTEKNIKKFRNKFLENM